MRIVVVVGCIILLLGMCHQASAQCSALVSEGIFETVSVSSDNVSISAFMNWVQDHRSGSSSSSAGGGISIPVIGSLNGSSEQYAQMESDYAAMSSGNSAARQRLTTLAKTVSTALAQRFNECMAIKGLHVWIETTDDPRVFKLAAVFNSPGPAQISAKIEGIDRVPSNLGCGDGIGRGTTITGSTRRMICTRTSRDAVTMILNSDSDPIGGGELKLASVPITAPQPPTPTCDSQVLVSRGASASHPRLTDGVVGPNVPGVNSGQPGGSFFVDLSRPEWIHHLILYPLEAGPGSDQTNTIIGYTSGGQQSILTVSRATLTTVPVTLYVDPSKGRDIKKIVVNTQSMNGRDWVAWSEFEVFACH